MYIKKYTPELLKLINNSLQNKEQELEIRLKDSYNSINSEIFYNILKRVKGMSGIKHIGDVETLDIQIGDIRISIIGSENILKICQTNDIKSIDSKYVEIIKKNMVKNIDINEYKLRFNLKNEKVLGQNNKEVNEIFKRWKNVDKTYRYKKRASFESGDKMFRFDLTILKSSNKKNSRDKNRIIKKKKLKDHLKKYVVKPDNILNFNLWFDGLGPNDDVEIMGRPKFVLISSKNIQKSNVFKNNLEYEVEVEFIGNKNNQKKNDREILIKMMENVSIVLQIVHKSYYIISEETRAMVSNEYKIKMGDYRFKAPMNVTLEKKNIIERNYEDYPNIVSIRKGYSVTDKADGERNLLIIVKDGGMFLMNRKNNIKDLGATCKELSGSILDCEYIVKDKHKKNINLLMAFDIYFYKDSDVRHKILNRSEEEKRENKISISRYELLTEFINILGDSIEKKKNNNLQVLKKKFYFGDDDIYNNSVGGKISEIENKLMYIDSDDTKYEQLKNEIKILKSDTKIFTESKKLYEKNYIYAIDGLIFTPRNLFVGQEPNKKKKNPYEGRWYRSFKWKPPEQNSIDFRVKIMKDDDEPEKDLIKHIKYKDSIVSYKTIILLIGYNPSIHTKHNSCRILNENIVFEEKYDMVPFNPTEPYIKNSHLAYIPIDNDGNIYTDEDRNIITDNTIIECVYDNKEHYFKWKPIRTRDNPQPNDFLTAVNVWNCIHNPITLDMIKTGDFEINKDDIYYNRNISRDNKKCVSMYDFHSYTKKQLITKNTLGDKNYLDLSVGRGGDINHWIDAGINNFVGIDISKDGLISDNGACNRILNKSIENKKIAENYFIIWGDSSKNLTNGEGGKDDLHKYYLDILYGNISIDDITSSKLKKIYNLGNIKKGNGFDVVSCQFSVHYFFKNTETLNMFLNNVSQSLNKGGRFIGTCLDGNNVFNELKDRDYITSSDKETLCWKIIKKYRNTEFNSNETSLGMTIDVYNESIGVSFEEYLVNFDYFIDLCSSFNLKLIEKKSFSQVFDEIAKDVKYGNIKEITEDLKKYSFLNNTFVFEKV